MEGQVQDVEASKREAELHLSALLQVAEKSTAERDALARLNAKAQDQRDRAKKELAKRDVIIGRLKEKLALSGRSAVSGWG